MTVLIVERDVELGNLWQRHLQRCGHEVTLVASQQAAIEALTMQSFAVVILNIGTDSDSPFEVSDFVGYRYPQAQVIFVTGARFFSDPAIFALAPNLRAVVQKDTPPDDLAAMVDHFASKDG